MGTYFIGLIISLGKRTKKIKISFKLFILKLATYQKSAAASHFPNQLCFKVNKIAKIES